VPVLSGPRQRRPTVAIFHIRTITIEYLEACHSFSLALKVVTDTTST
jgi:hypothetical protein